MKKTQSEIPIHRLKDRHSGGISVRYMENESGVEKKDIMRAHRDDHYVFLFQKSGSSNFVVDFNEIVVNQAAVYCILPGQVHYVKTVEKVNGWFLAIDTLLVDERYRRIFEVEILAIYPQIVNPVNAEHLEKCFQSLFLILQDKQDGIRQSILSNLSAACIGLIAEAYLKQEERCESFNNRSAVITRQFHKLLKRDFRINKAPSQYASILNISLSYLNECVKITTGIPVSISIQQEIMLEAKRLLYYSAMTVKEIAFNLGFEDHTYFSRLFLKVSGCTPVQFRKKSHE